MLIVFFLNIIIYVHVNLDKSRLGAAASLDGGGGPDGPWGGAAAPLRGPNCVPVLEVCC